MRHTLHFKMSSITVGLALFVLGTPTTLGGGPTVIGPIPVTAVPGDPSHNYPFFCRIPDLEGHGWVEEEFFLEGTASRYSTPPLATGTILSSGHPFQTRMIVRRPDSPHQFDGTVVLEWLNVTAGYDLDAIWGQSYKHFIRRGYAWVGVSAQRIGIHHPGTGLRAWSPVRYGSLDVTQGGILTDDSLAYDIFTQAAQAIRDPSGVDPMGGLPVERVLAVGASQSAGRLVNYHNSIQPLANEIDGFILAVGGDRLRTDLDVKVFKVLSETDVAGNSNPKQALIRQPDSINFRRWEVAGTAHLDFHGSQAFEFVQARDLGPSITPSCDLPPLSRIPLHFALNAALDHLVEWVRSDTPPPSAPEIELQAIGPPIVVARDSYGNARGGIRLPQLEVAIATNTGVNSGPGWCRLYGSFEPFDTELLKAIYFNHGGYVSSVVQVTSENLWRGFLVLEDAVTTIREAAGSSYPKR